MLANRKAPKWRGASPQPLPALRSLARVPAQVRAVPYLLPPARAARRHPGRHQVELVRGACMSMTDPIADFLARIRNAHPRAPRREVLAPSSKLKQRHRRGPQGRGLHRRLRRARRRRRACRDRASACAGPTRHATRSPACAARSRPGQRMYVRHGDDPQGPLAAWASRSSPRRKGVMTDRDARKEGVGGELLCEVW